MNSLYINNVKGTRQYQEFVSCLVLTFDNTSEFQDRQRFEGGEMEDLKGTLGFTLHKDKSI